MGFPIDAALQTKFDAKASSSADQVGRGRSDGGKDGYDSGKDGKDGGKDGYTSEHGTLAVSGRHVERDAVAPVELGFGRWSRWVAVAGGFGYFPIAPGTAGSIAGILLFLAGLIAGAELSPSGFLGLHAIAISLLTLLGVRAAGRAEVDFGRRDDGRIVIDEVVGQLIALVPLTVFLAARMPLDLGAIAGSNGALGSARGDAFVIFLEVVTAFVLFRLFDVWKPGAIRWAERRFEGGVGVMADDMVAGLHAALGLYLIHSIAFERLFSTHTVGELAGVGEWATVTFGEWAVTFGECAVTFGEWAAAHGWFASMIGGLG